MLLVDVFNLVSEQYEEFFAGYNAYDLFDAIQNVEIEGESVDIEDAVKIADALDILFNQELDNQSEYDHEIAKALGVEVSDLY